MKNTFLIRLLIMASLSLIFLKHAFASSPVWTFAPLTATTISVTTSGTETIQYIITNQSSRTHTLAMRPMTGIHQLTSGPGICASTFTLASFQSCTLSLEVVGSELPGDKVGGPIVCQSNNTLQCYQPSISDRLNITRISVSSTTLTSSVSALALSVNDPATNAALTGAPRQIIINNTGSSTAYAVSYSVSPSLPSDSSISPTSCGNITAGDSCTLTITPGSTPSAAPGALNPTPLTLTLSGENTNQVSVLLNILTYGSVYQGGYLFSVDDTTSTSQSIGGKVAALNNQLSPLSGVIWSSNGNGGANSDVSYDNIPGITETSTSSLSGCNGKSDGACNSNTIIAYYSPPTTNPAVNLSYYAAGICSQYSQDDYIDWYLPSICEMGYDGLNQGSGCGSSSSPIIQNIASNLVNNQIITLEGQYWASTEYSVDPSTQAWVNAYLSGASLQLFIGKNTENGIRCIRALS